MDTVIKISDLGFEGIKLIETKLHRDQRGFFGEFFNAKDFAPAGLPVQFSLMARSHSAPSVLRGLHFQYEPAQGKLVSVIEGRILDVVVDLRSSSPTLGSHLTVELSGDSGRMLWVPFGFAHGFCVLGDRPADVVYLLDAPYGPEGEGGIKWSDPDISIKWPVEKPFVSEKDNRLPSFKEFKASLGRSFK